MVLERKLKDFATRWRQYVLPHFPMADKGLKAKNKNKNYMQMRQSTKNKKTEEKQITAKY